MRPRRSPKGKWIWWVNWSHDQKMISSAFIGYNCCRPHGGGPNDIRLFVVLLRLPLLCPRFPSLHNNGHPSSPTSGREMEVVYFLYRLVQVLDHHHLRSRSTRIGDNVIWSLMSCCSSTVQKRPCRGMVDSEEINFSGSASGARFDTLSGATTQSMFRTCAHVLW